MSFISSIEPAQLLSIYPIILELVEFLNQIPKSLFPLMYLSSLFTVLKCNSLGFYINLDNKLAANIMFGPVAVKYSKQPIRLRQTPPSILLAPSSLHNFSFRTEEVLTGLQFYILHFFKISFGK